MKNKTVGIITRTKNRPLLLDRALSSLGGQIFRDFVWVLVNDGGLPEPVDGVAERARAQGMETLVFHNPKSLGMEAASNIGIRGSQSTFLVIHDDDDSWEPAFLEKTVAFLQAHSGKRYGGVITHTTTVEETLTEHSWSTVRRYGFNPWLYAVYLADMARANVFAPISFLFKREIYDRIGGFDETLPVLGDWMFNLRFLRIADIAVIREALANYHLRVASTDPIYGNTVIQGLDRHREYDAAVRNLLLREDLDRGALGLGFLLNFAKGYEGAETLLNLQNIRRMVQGSRVMRYAKRILRCDDQ